jgi:hypothetical protein
MAYHYRTLDDRDVGRSTSGRRARDDAARIARETGQMVELVTPGETWRVLPPEVVSGYATIFDALLAMEMVPDPTMPRRLRARTVPFAEDGCLAWETFTQQMAHRINDCDPCDPFRGVLAKLRGYAVR